MTDIELDLYTTASIRYLDEHYRPLRGGTEPTFPPRDKCRKEERAAFIEGGNFIIKAIEKIIERNRRPECSPLIKDLEETIIKLKDGRIL